MKIIKVLGAGCPSCLTTEEVIKKVANEQGVEVEIIKITDIQEIMEYDVMSTPAVVINEKVIIKGRIPSVGEVKSFLKGEEDDCCNENDSSCCSPADEATDSCCN
jgi:small redox-active disulfide protein 2